MASSHPVSVRGLKHHRPIAKAADGTSHPVSVRGLKLQGGLGVRSLCLSHPVSVRGLKHRKQVLDGHFETSHPVSVRGLKPPLTHTKASVQPVAPRVGAWIETADLPCKPTV